MWSLKINLVSVDILMLLFQFLLADSHNHASGMAYCAAQHLCGPPSYNAYIIISRF